MGITGMFHSVRLNRGGGVLSETYGTRFDNGLTRSITRGRNGDMLFSTSFDRGHRRCGRYGGHNDYSPASLASKYLGIGGRGFGFGFGRGFGMRDMLDRFRMGGLERGLGFNRGHRMPPMRPHFPHQGWGHGHHGWGHDHHGWGHGHHGHRSKADDFATYAFTGLSIASALPSIIGGFANMFSGRGVAVG